MSSDQAAMLTSLQSLRAADFDKTYARQQALAHDQALAIMQSYATSGMDPNLQKVAQATVPIIQHRLEMAQQPSAVLGGS